MVKTATKQPPRRGPVRQSRIKKANKEDQEQRDEIFEQSGSLHDDDSESSNNEQSSGSDEDDDDSDEESSEEEVREPAVKQMQFRERRGTKMNYLINRKKQQEEDPFWAGQGGQLFGDLDDGDNDQQDYVQSSSGRDEFDSDFDQTESEHEQQSPQQKQQDEEEAKNQRKKRQQMMRKIKMPVQQKKTQKVVRSQQQRKQALQVSNRFIHQMFSQQQLLGQAATTQYFNWLSLKKLISLETQKKDFTKRSHHLEGPKVIYRDRIGADGVREQTFELVQTKVEKLSDLTRFMHAQ